MDLWERFYPDYGLGLEGFMNVSLVIPFNTIVPATPSISNLAGIVRPDERGLEAGLLVFETQNSPTTSGLDFPNGVTILMFGRKFTEFWGLAGSHMLAANYATGDFTSFESNGWISFPPIIDIAPNPTENRGTWSATYVGEQQLWEDPCDEKRYTKLWGYVGLSDETVNPFAVTAAITVEAFGYFERRPDDRMGVGYFYSGLSDDFRNLVSVVEPSGDLHGGEIYYNTAVTPWFHLTFDLQAVRPGFRTNDTALVLGLRGKLDF